MTKKFYELSPAERVAKMPVEEKIKKALLANQTATNANLIENYLTDYRQPEGVLHQLWLDGTAYDVPMVTEEPSVIAAANNGARMLARGGGLVSVVSEVQPMTTGQLLFVGCAADDLVRFINENETIIYQVAQKAKPSIYQRGGGLRDIQVRRLPHQQVSVDFLIDTKEAMGANMVNTILEAEKAVFDPFSTYCLGAILSNVGTELLVTVRGKVPYDVVGGVEVAQRIVALNQFGRDDVVRAVTENKGIFNGITAVTIATGNDDRAVTAAGHAYASHDGQYRSLTEWQLDHEKQALSGEITLPLPLGSVGGTINTLPQAQQNMALLGRPAVAVLRRIVAAVGLAQNLAALKAIVREGIQTGHMRMQYRSLAIQVGATANEIPQLVKQFVALPIVDTTTAKQTLKELRNNES